MHRYPMNLGFLAAMFAGGLVALATARQATAAQVDAIWVGGSGNWNSAVNWFPTVIPNNGVGGNTYRVKIDNGAGGVSIVSLDTTVQIDTLTIDAGDALGINDGRLLALVGPISNAGTLSLNAVAGLSDLRLDADVSLSGGGTLVMSNSNNNRIYSNGVHRLTNVNNLIRGSGQLGVNLMGLTNQGVIQADGSNALTIDPSGTGAINTGTLRATNNATLVLAAGNYDNAGGVIDAQNGSTVSIGSSAVVTGGILTSAGTGAIVPNSGRLHNVINNGLLDVQNNLLAILTGTMTNNATIAMNAGGALADLRIDSDVTLNGGGTVAMSNSNNNRIFSDSGARILTNNSTIRGSGQVGVNLMGIINQNLIQADHATPLVIDPSATGLINTGTLRATGGASLVLLTGSYDNAGGTIEAQNGSTVSVGSNAVITGGVVTTAGTGAIIPNTGRLHNVTNNGQVAVQNGLLAILTGIMTNNATIALNSGGALSDLRIDSDVTLNGGGTVAMSNSNNNRIFSDSGTRILTNNNTIRGSGQVGVNIMGITNQNLIQADQSTPLVLDPSATGLINTGTLRATNGATLTLAGGDYDNTSGVIDAENGSTVTVGSGAVVMGGVLTTAGTGAIIPNAGRLHNVTNNGQVTIVNGLSGVLTGTMTNNANISMNSTGALADLLIHSDVLLIGGGTLTMSNGSNNRIYSDTGTRRLTNSSTIRGAGQIGVNLMGLTNYGTIEADQTTNLAIDPSDGPGFANVGQLKVTGTGGLSIAAGNFTTTGEVTVNPGRQLTCTGVYTQTGGTTLVNGVLSASGGVALQGGVLKGAGPVSNAVNHTGGIIQPGDSPGAMAINGTYTEPGGGTLYIELGGMTPVTQHDQLQVSGAASIAGTLRVDAVNGFVPALSQTFVILTTSARTGTFFKIQTFGFPPGLTVQANYNPTNVTLQVVAGSNPRLGDMNCDNTVDVLDIPPFIQAVLDPAAYTANNPNCFLVRADLDGNGFIDGREIQSFVRCITGSGCP